MGHGHGYDESLEGSSRGQGGGKGNNRLQAQLGGGGGGEDEVEGGGGGVNDDYSDDEGSEKYERDVAVLNKCFDDIEKFIGRLQHAASAFQGKCRRCLIFVDFF